jgi:MOSC domain-containing protein YiiM
VSTGAVVAVSRNEAYAFSKPVREQIILRAGVGVDGDAHAGTTVKHRSRVRADPSQPNLRQVHLLAAELFDEVRAQGYEVAPGQLGENVTTRGIDLLRLPRGTILRFGAAPRAAAEAGSALRNAAEADPTPRVAAEAGSAPGNAAEADPTPRNAADFGPDGRTALSGVLAAAHRAVMSAETAAAVAAVTAAAERDRLDPRPAVILAGLRNPCAQINGLHPGLLRCVLGRDDAGNPIRKAGVMGVVLRGGPVRPGDPVAVVLPPAPHLPLERV